MGVACTCDNSHFLCYVLVSPETEMLCNKRKKNAFGNKEHTMGLESISCSFLDNLIIFGGDIYQVK